ncbi:LysM peptidoglycan-binding domain-containing protein [Methylorubrum extorquens]|uniref:LysM peptidoglycan-binding domain-containing protein n=1 Tax=Methylorubrum extorquens TaxID=408 RepID=UPI0022378F21|nr:LysM domain-containing protein [Methylorubrum extorquens]UYW28365.1 LysM peptidoglycan-binding domain-containing protein [Methylorubrum extorquens]
MALLSLLTGMGVLTCDLGLAQEAPCANGTVQVQPEDTLSRIASRCDVSEGALLAANPSIDGSGDLQVGTTLLLRPKTGQSQRLGDRLNHFGREANEAVGRIAGQVGSSAQDLLDKNPDLKGRLEGLGQRFGLGDGASAPSLTVTPDQGPAGSTVTLSATGLPKDEPLMIGVGAPNTAFQVLQSARTSEKGTLDADVKVPERQGGTRLVFVLRSGDSVKLTSKPFRVAP